MEHASCWNSDPTAKTATRHCPRIHRMRAFAAMSVPFVQPASIRCCSMSVPIAAAGLCRDRSGRRITGRTITFSVTTRPAPQSNSVPSTRNAMRILRCSCGIFRPDNAESSDRLLQPRRSWAGADLNSLTASRLNQPRPIMIAIRSNMPSYAAITLR